MCEHRQNARCHAFVSMSVSVSRGLRSQISLADMRAGVWAGEGGSMSGTSMVICTVRRAATLMGERAARWMHGKKRRPYGSALPWGSSGAHERVQRPPSALPACLG